MSFGKLLLALCLTFFGANAANAAYSQSTVEAEAVSGGTIIADLNASGGEAVTRTTVGGYTWWVPTISSLPTGNYSLYVRIALAPTATASTTFGPFVFYNNTQIAATTVTISNHTYAWVRVAGFTLSQNTQQLRISDYSGAGLDVDKLAIVNDDVQAASGVAQSGTAVITDANAASGQAVTRASVGGYFWWTPTQANLEPGDYTVWVRAASSDGNSHNLGTYVALNNGTAAGPINVAISSTTYQWYAFNQFNNSGGSQAIRISDYSDAGLKIDQISLIRRTPYDFTSGAQQLFSAGNAALGPQTAVTFNGTPSGIAMSDPGRVALALASVNTSTSPASSTISAYFRQLQPALSSGNNKIFQIYEAQSTDGGLTFNLYSQAPVIAVNTTASESTSVASTYLEILNAYDPQITKTSSGYTMVFEGATQVCGNASSLAAFSTNGLTSWQVQSIPACVTGAIGTGSASVPTYYATAELPSQQFLQWADVTSTTAERYQVTLAGSVLQTNTTYTSNATMAPYQIPADTASWDAVNTSATNAYYEDGYYYMVYEGANANNPNCSGQWGLGIMRTQTPAVLSSWVRSPINPYLLGAANTSCWIEYPDLLMTPVGLFLYYQDDYINNQSTQGPNAIFRQQILN